MLSDPDIVAGLVCGKEYGTLLMGRSRGSASRFSVGNGKASREGEKTWQRHQSQNRIVQHRDTISSLPSAIITLVDSSRKNHVNPKLSLVLTAGRVTVPSAAYMIVPTDHAYRVRTTARQAPARASSRFTFEDLYPRKGSSGAFSVGVQLVS